MILQADSKTERRKIVMILKIQRYVGREKWEIYDNLRKVSWSECDASDFVPDGKEVKAFPDVLILDHFAKRKEFNPAHLSSNTFCVLLRCKEKVGDEPITIVFDTIAYLCNDLGRTIEKIVANYNE